MKEDNKIKPKLEFPEYNIYEVKIKCQLEPKKERKWRPMDIGKEKKNDEIGSE